MGSNPLVSAVITTYKRELPVLIEAVESIKKQTYPNIEIIIVDDNGVGTEYQKQNEETFCGTDSVIYSANERNSGAQVSRNRGIELSHGEYVAFLDDDDLWLPEKIEKQLARIESAGADMVYCNGYVVTDGDLENRDRIYNNSSFDTPATFERLLANDCIGSTSQAMIRRECFDEVGLFDTDMPARQDYEMWIRISRKCSIVSVPDCLFLHRMHKGEQISKSNPKCLRAYSLLYEKYKENYRKDPGARASLFYVISRFYKRSGDRAGAAKYVLRSFFSSPAFLIKKAVGKIQN